MADVEYCDLCGDEIHPDAAQNPRSGSEAVKRMLAVLAGWLLMAAAAWSMDWTADERSRRTRRWRLARGLLSVVFGGGAVFVAALLGVGAASLVSEVWHS